MSRVVERTLEKLQEGAEVTRDLIDLVLAGKTGYVEALRRSSRFGPRRFKNDWAELYRKRQSYYSLLNQLKRDRLIQKRQNGKSAAWSITSRGTRHLINIRERLRRRGKFPHQKYSQNTQKELVIVSFDVPERERKKRNWLRQNLLALDFERIQKSVWLGTHGVPRDFFEDLKTMKLLPHVHIVAVTRRGTIASAERK